MIPPPTPEFLILAAAMAASSGFAVYMAARPQQEDDMERQLTFEDAIANQQAVLAEVEENHKDWVAVAVSLAEGLPAGELGTGEDIRERLLNTGLRAPKHPNAWGALFNVLVKRRIIEHTGQYRPMRVKSSHGRKTGVYAKVPG